MSNIISFYALWFQILFKNSSFPNIIKGLFFLLKVKRLFNGVKHFQMEVLEQRKGAINLHTEARRAYVQSKLPVFLIYLFYLLKFIYFNWRLIILQYYSG